MEESTNGASAASGSQIDFEAVKLYPGAPVQIEHLNRAGQKYGLRFIGIVKGRSILLTLPLVDGQPVRMPPGQTYVIRGFNGRHAYAFTSRVIQARSRPFPYVHFSWPVSVESKTVRKALRVNVNLPAAVVGEGETLPVTMLDLSANGSMIDSSRTIGEVGSIINVQFEIAYEGLKSSLILPAKIRNAKYSKDGNSIHVGVEFENIPQSELLMLSNYILTTTVNA